MPCCRRQGEDRGLVGCECRCCRTWPCQDLTDSMIVHVSTGLRHQDPSEWIHVFSRSVFEIGEVPLRQKVRSFRRRSRLARRRVSLVCRSRDSFRTSRKVALAVLVASRRRAQSTQRNHISLAMSRSHGTSFRIRARNLAQRRLLGQKIRRRGCRRGCREQFIHAADESAAGMLRRWNLRAATSSWSSAVPGGMQICSPGRPKAHPVCAVC